MEAWLQVTVGCIGRLSCTHTNTHPRVCTPLAVGLVQGQPAQDPLGCASQHTGQSQTKWACSWWCAQDPCGPPAGDATLKLPT